MHETRRIRTLALAAAAAGALPLNASAQAFPVRTALQAAQDDTMQKLRCPLTFDVEAQRLEDVIGLIGRLSGADIEPLWGDQRSVDGLDKDAIVTLRVRDLPALAAIERLLAELGDDFGQSPTWQMSATGAIQIGPRAALNRYRRTVIYDVRDLLMQTPDHPHALEIDLQSALQSQGGAGGQSPLRGAEQTDPEPRPSLDQRAAEIERLLTDLVEPDEWASRGGDGAIVTRWRGVLIIRAADYIHRGINGYLSQPGA
ncbi:MAG: hypothetical protein ACF8R7_10665 [Phycisphaerales bacterium JB039]